MKYSDLWCLCSLIAVLCGPSFSHGSMINEKILHVGKELVKETLPLRNGACLYQLQGLRPQTWTDGSSIDQGGMYVLVNVEPEGIVAIPGKQEREYVMFNIVCDELLLGIPHKAWYVVILALICLVLAFVVPSFLPPFLLPKNGNPPLFDRTVTKGIIIKDS